MVILRPSAIRKMTVTSPSGSLLGVGRDRDLEVALLLVGLLELLGGAVDLDGVVDAPSLSVDLLGEGGGVELLVAGELTMSRTNGRSTTMKVTFTPPSKSSTLSWTSSKKPSAKMARMSSARRVGENGVPALVLTRPRMTASWTRRFPWTARSLTRDLAAGLGGGGAAPPAGAAGRAGGQKKWRERLSPGAHESERPVVPRPSVPPISAPPARAAAPPTCASRKTKFSPSTSSSSRAPS